MKRKILIPLIAIFLIGIVSAGIGIGALSESRDLEKAQRDVLLSKTEEATIAPEVIITCSGDDCLWSASQEGIISSSNNHFSKFNITDTEVQDLVADAVLDRLSNYADAEISRGTYEDWGTGNVIINEKK